MVLPLLTAQVPWISPPLVVMDEVRHLWLEATPAVALGRQGQPGQGGIEGSKIAGMSLARPGQHYPSCISVASFTMRLGFSVVKIVWRRLKIVMAVDSGLFWIVLVHMALLYSKWHEVV